MDMYRRTFAEINLDHLIFNYNYLKNIVGDRFFCPMIKANAYGHGDCAVAKKLQEAGATHLGVCLIEEAILIRNSGVQAKILVFRGFDKEGAEKIVQYDLTPVVSTWEQLQFLEDAVEETLHVHLKFDTGMNRLGFHFTEAEKLKEYFKKSKKIRLDALLTHFYSSEDALNANGESAKQCRLFSQIADEFASLNVDMHLLNSGGLLNYQRVATQKDHPLNFKKWGARPGLALFGYHSVPDLNVPLKPVMNLRSVVNNVRMLDAGEGVSYGHRWRAKQASFVAIVPIGYADGYSRRLSNQAEALLMGERVPVIGSICMDYLTLDISSLVTRFSIETIKKQDVVLFGYDEHDNFIHPGELAQKSETITWEILTSVGERVPRIYKGVL